MPSKENSISFYLNILEISGRQITNTYVKDLSHYMNKKGLKYNFEIITDEAFYVDDRHLMRGGRATFPYSHFEKAFNGIGNMLSFNNNETSLADSEPNLDLNIETKNYGTIDPVPDKIDSIDESEQSENTSRDTALRDTIVDTLLVYNPLELNDKTTINTQAIPYVNLDIPNDYDGVIHMLLTIHVNNKENIIQGGITQLTQFLHSVM